MEGCTVPANESKWPFHDAQVKHRADKISTYAKYGVYPVDIAKYGEPIEIIQGFLLYTGNGNPYPLVQASWSGGGCDGATLDIKFDIASLNKPEEKPKRIVTKLGVISDRKEPYLVEELRSSSCPCGEDNFKVVTRYPGPCHHNIGRRLWLENFLYRYTEKRRNLKDPKRRLKHTFQMMNRIYEASEKKPWFVSDTIPSEVIETYNDLKDRRVGSVQTIDGVCEALQMHYLEKVRERSGIGDGVKLTTRKLGLSDFL